MKSLLKFTALLTSLALPGAFALEFAGGAAAASVNSLQVFAGFVAAVIVLTLANDYAAPRRVRKLAPISRIDAGSFTAQKSEHALAA